MALTLDRVVSLMQCPRTGTAVRREGDQIISDAGETYPIIAGKPIMVRTIREIHTAPPSAAIVSMNIPEFSPPMGIRDDAIILHLGSGNVPTPDARVISLDVLPNQNVDVVAEAEALPFKTCTIDHVHSGAVFEHVHNPILAAQEARRVVKENGTLHIDTAFMQGYHGFPNHFFNMTPQAAETFLVDDFILENSGVPPEATPAHALVDLGRRFLECLPAEQAQRLAVLPFNEALKEIEVSKRKDSSLLSGLSEYEFRSLAASFFVTARKPRGYEQRNDDEAKREARLAYYSARMGVIQRHHEINLYKRLSMEKGRALANAPKVPALTTLLAESVPDPLSRASLDQAIDKLKRIDAELLAFRNMWIGEYLR
jgi:SAM-dependent methyltransferase